MDRSLPGRSLEHSLFTMAPPDFTDEYTAEDDAQFDAFQLFKLPGNTAQTFTDNAGLQSKRDKFLAAVNEANHLREATRKDSNQLSRLPGMIADSDKPSDREFYEDKVKEYTKSIRDAKAMRAVLHDRAQLELDAWTAEWKKAEKARVAAEEEDRKKKAEEARKKAAEKENPAESATGPTRTYARPPPRAQILPYHT